MLLVSYVAAVPTGFMTVPVLLGIRGSRLPPEVGGASKACGVALLDTILVGPGLYLFLSTPFETLRRIGAALGLSP